MNVYAVIATSEHSAEPLRLAVESAFPDNFIAVSNTFWFVADALDARVVSKKLGIAEGTPPTSGLVNVIVIWALSYWGSAPVNIWAWISQKIQQVAPVPPQQPMTHESTK